MLEGDKVQISQDAIVNHATPNEGENYLQEPSSTGHASPGIQGEEIVWTNILTQDCQWTTMWTEEPMNIPCHDGWITTRQDLEVLQEENSRQEDQEPQVRVGFY